MRLLLFPLFFSLSIVFFTINCARRGTPTGGAKDSIPPVMIAVTPPYKSTHFKSEKIKLYFDEYVKFKDLNKQLIVSPPLKHFPIITPLGSASRSITINIIDTLLENTTYSFNFGNSIVDNNEGNELRNFKYIFSTGDYVDSLNIKGKIKDAFEMDTENNISVLLFAVDKNYTDSIVYKKKPTYITNTLDTVNFEITNIKSGTYQMIALKDFNNNYIYNPKQDKIAFVKDHITIPSDSLYTLRLFKEMSSFRLIRPLENRRGKIIFGFEGEADSLDIKLLTKTPPNFRKFINFEKDKDTLNYWYTPFETDSLQFLIRSKNIDKFYTVKLRTSKQDSLSIKTTITKILHPRDTFAIETNIPIESLEPTKINVFDKDTLAVDFTTILNSNKTKLQVNFKKKPEQEYRVSILPKAIVDFYGDTNDTLQYRLRTLNIEEYGNIEINLKYTRNTPLLIELINEKGEFIDRQFSESKKIVFNNLLPSKYFIRAIIDENKNKKWDTGNFLKKTPPEKVVYLKTKIELRANWTVYEIFDIKL